MNSHIASYESEAFHRRLSGATNGRRLPPAQPWRLRKLADTNVMMKFMSLNIGTMTGKSIELADIMTRRNIDIACIQETRWKGAKAREIGEGYTMFYHGYHTKRNGVAIVVGEKWRDNILEINIISDRLITAKLLIDTININIVSACAPQVGCTDEEKEEFWEKLEELIRSFSEKDKIVIGVDLNGHIGRGNTGYEIWHGGFGHGEKNQEGDNILEFTQAYDLALGNSLFKKREEYYVTYMSGTNITVIDYILVRRQDLRDLKDCKVIPGESIASQHRLLVASVEFKAQHKKQQRARVNKIKWYMLKQQEKKCELSLRLAEHNMGRRKYEEETTWEYICHMINNNAKEILGETSGGKNVERESWWGNDDVQKAVKEKRDIFK